MSKKVIHDSRFMNKENKMEEHHWTMLFMAAGFCDFVGLFYFIPNFFTAGWFGIIVNIFVGFIFITWAIIWKDKFGKNFFPSQGVNFIISWILEASPAGGVCPTWTYMVWRVKKNYSGGGVVGIATKTIRARSNVPQLNNKPNPALANA